MASMLRTEDTISLFLREETIKSLETRTELKIRGQYDHEISWGPALVYSKNTPPSKAPSTQPVSIIHVAHQATVKKNKKGKYITTIPIQHLDYRNWPVILKPYCWLENKNTLVTEKSPPLGGVHLISRKGGINSIIIQDSFYESKDKKFYSPAIPLKMFLAGRLSTLGY